MWRVCNDLPFETMIAKAGKVMNKQEMRPGRPFRRRHWTLRAAIRAGRPRCCRRADLRQVQGEGAAKEADRLEHQLENHRCWGCRSGWSPDEPPRRTAPALFVRIGRDRLADRRDPGTSGRSRLHDRRPVGAHWARPRSRRPRRSTYSTASPGPGDRSRPGDGLRLGQAGPPSAWAARPSRSRTAPVHRHKGRGGQRPALRPAPPTVPSRPSAFGAGPVGPAADPGSHRRASSGSSSTGFDCDIARDRFRTGLSRGHGRRAIRLPVSVNA